MVVGMILYFGVVLTTMALTEEAKGRRAVHDCGYE